MILGDLVLKIFYTCCKLILYTKKFIELVVKAF